MVGALSTLKDPIFGLAVLLPCALFLAVRAQRRRALGQLLASAEFHQVITDHGDHLRVSVALHLEPIEPFRLRRWRVELVYADLEHAPHVQEIAVIGEEGALDEPLNFGSEVALAGMLAVPHAWLEHAQSALVGNAEVGWLVRVRLDFSPIDAWTGQTEAVENLLQWVTLMN